MSVKVNCALLLLLPLSADIVAVSFGLGSSDAVIAGVANYIINNCAIYACPEPAEECLLRTRVITYGT